MADAPKSHLVSENPGPARLQGRAAVHLNGPAAEHQRRERALKSSEVRYRRLFETAPYGILVLDAETGVVVDANPFICRLLGYEQAELLDHALWSIPAFKNAAVTKNHFRDLLRTSHLRYDDLPVETRQGQIRHIELVGTLFLADNKQFVQCTLHDITDRVNHEHAAGERARQESAATELSTQRTRDQETHDQASGMVNRWYLEETLPRELHRAARAKVPLTVTVLAIDRLAELRERHGDDAVTALLREAARVVREHLRRSDMASRYADDQFVLVLPQSSSRATRERVNQIRASLAALEIAHGDQRLGGLTLAAGIATAGIHGSTTRELLKAACAALDEARDLRGGGVVVYHTEENT